MGVYGPMTSNLLFVALLWLWQLLCKQLCTGTAIGSTKNNTLLARVLHKMNWEIKIAICHTYFIAFCVLDSPLRLTLGHLTNTKYGIRNTEYGVRSTREVTGYTQDRTYEMPNTIQFALRCPAPCPLSLGQVQPRGSGATVKLTALTGVTTAN